MVRKQEPKEQCGRKTISPHYTTPEGSLGDERQVLHFVLVSLDHSWERLRHVIVLKVQPQFRKKCITQKNKTTDINLPQLDFGKQKNWYNFTGTRRWKTKPQILDFKLSPCSVCCMLSKPQILFYLHVSAQLNSWTRTIYRTDYIVLIHRKTGRQLLIVECTDWWWLRQNRHCPVKCAGRAADSGHSPAAMLQVRDDTILQ